VSVGFSVLELKSQPNCKLVIYQISNLSVACFLNYTVGHIANTDGLHLAHHCPKQG
jgi:hypothetical protein